MHIGAWSVQYSNQKMHIGGTTVNGLSFSKTMTMTYDLTVTNYQLK